MFKKTKYMSKGGTVKRKGGGMAGMKKTKYASKGGSLKRKSGGTIRRKSGGRTK